MMCFMFYRECWLPGGKRVIKSKRSHGLSEELTTIFSRRCHQFFSVKGYAMN